MRVCHFFGHKGTQSVLWAALQATRVEITGRGLDTPGVDGEVKVLLVIQAALRHLLYLLQTFMSDHCSHQLLSAPRLPFVNGSQES